MKRSQLSRLVALAVGLTAHVPVSAQISRSDESSKRAAEFGVASGMLIMTTEKWDAGPTVEARYIQPVTRSTSLRGRIGYTHMLGRRDTMSEIGRPLLHGALEASWALTARASKSVLYGTFGMTSIAFDYTDQTRGGAFYLVPRLPDGSRASVTRLAFGPSAGIGLSVAVNDRISLSGEVQGMLNLMYPYYPPYGGSAMAGIGWML